MIKSKVPSGWCDYESAIEEDTRGPIHRSGSLSCRGNVLSRSVSRQKYALLNAVGFQLIRDQNVWFVGGLVAVHRNVCCVGGLVAVWGC